MLCVASTAVPACVLAPVRALLASGAQPLTTWPYLGLLASGILVFGAVRVGYLWSRDRSRRLIGWCRFKFLCVCCWLQASGSVAYFAHLTSVHGLYAAPLAKHRDFNAVDNYLNVANRWGRGVRVPCPDRSSISPMEIPALAVQPCRQISVYFIRGPKWISRLGRDFLECGFAREEGKEGTWIPNETPNP